MFEMSDHATKERVLSEVLECTICLDFPASPIHVCQNGHIFCGICQEKVDTCGLCQTNLRVSILGERLSKQLDLKKNCHYADEGCKALVRTAEMKDHIKKCYFREFECNEGGCKGTKIKLKSVQKHMEEFHKGRKRATQGRYVWAIKAELLKFEDSDWPLYYAKDYDETFLCHTKIVGQMVHHWVTILGDQETAEQFRLTVDIDFENGNKTKTVTYDMPVLPYHDFPDFVEPSPYFIAFPKTAFTKSEAENSTALELWRNYSIRKV